MMDRPSDPEQAVQNVEFLSNRFSALFAQLHREEAELRAVEARNRDLELKLGELRRRESQDASLGRAQVDGRLAEVAELRREVDIAERRLALGGGEVDALAAAAAAYARQSERFRERFEEEVAREHNTSLAFKQRADELAELRLQRSELRAELEGAEAGKAKVEDDLRLVMESTAVNCRSIASLEHCVQESRERGTVSEADAYRKREELLDLDRKLGRVQVDIQEIAKHLDNERSDGRLREEQWTAQCNRRKQCEDDLRSLTIQLEERRKDGAETQHRLAEQVNQLKQLRERLKAEERCQQEEQRACENSQARLIRLRAELPCAEKALHAVESDLLDVRRRSVELEERCTAQRAWRDEARQQANSSEAALSRLQEELRILSVDRSRLLQELEDVTADKTRLEVEVEVALPALQDARRSCNMLENHLSERIRELGEEVEKARRYRAEALSSQGQLQVLQRHQDLLSARLQEQKAYERQMGTCAVSIDSFRQRFEKSGSYEPEAAPMATIGLDTNCDGKVDTYIIGADRNRDGIPDVLQRPNDAPTLSTGFNNSRDYNTTPYASNFPMQRYLDDSSSVAQQVEGWKSPAAWQVGAPLRGGSQGNQSGSLAAVDAVRFLCDFVSREEERLGLASARRAVSATPPSLTTNRIADP